METRLVEEEHRFLVRLLGLDEEHEVEREKPLEPLAAALKLDLYPRSAVVRDPYPKEIAVGVVPDRMPPLLPPR